MKKNGFIATSILYSFFLVFVTLFVALISAYLHNRILLSNMNEAAWDTLVGINNTKISDLSVGDYISFDTDKAGSVINPGAKWITAYITTNGDNKTYYFISDTLAQKQDVIFKASYDTIEKVHVFTPVLYRELVTSTSYTNSFYIPGFKVYLPKASLLENIRKQDVHPDILEAIYDINSSYIIEMDKAISGYQQNQFYEYRMYNFTLGNTQNNIVPSYCGGSYNGSKVTYNANNTFGYINVVKDSVKNERYVDYCSYASPIAYVHDINDLVVSSTENKVSGDLVENLYSASYSYRLVAEITVNSSQNNTYIAGGKGNYMDPYLFTNGVKQ